MTSVYTTATPSVIVHTSTGIWTICDKCTASPSTQAPVPSTPAPLQPSITTVVYVSPTEILEAQLKLTCIVSVGTSITTCPVETTITSGASTYVSSTSSLSTVLISTTSTVCTACVTPTVPSAPASSSTDHGVPVHTTPKVEGTPSPAPAPVPAPAVLPRCLNTWMYVTQCKNNADSNCYCVLPEFTDSIIDCVEAWGVSKEEIQSALSYLAGICAPQVPSNPAVITHIPSTITLLPTPAATTPVATTSTVSATIPGADTNTVTVSTSASTAAAQPSTPAAVVPPPVTTIAINSNTYTVPQVALVTQSSSAVLVAGTPSPTPAAPTGPTTTPAGAPYPTGPAAPSTFASTTVLPSVVPSGSPVPSGNATAGVPFIGAAAGRVGVSSIVTVLGGAIVAALFLF